MGWMDTQFFVKENRVSDEGHSGSRYQNSYLEVRIPYIRFKQADALKFNTVGLLLLNCKSDFAVGDEERHI